MRIFFPIRVLFVWTVVLCAGVWPCAAVGEQTTSDRIADQRERAAQRELRGEQLGAAQDPELVAPPDSTPPEPTSPEGVEEPADEAGDEGAVPLADEPPASVAEHLAVDREHESELLSGPTGVNPGETPRDGSDKSPLGRGWVLRTLGSLGVVIVLIFCLRWLLGRLGVAGGVRAASIQSGGSSAVIEVLSRTTLAPRNHVLLLRVGHRILIVNDSVGGMRTLASVDEPDEVAALLQGVQSARDSSMTRSFGKVMARLSGQGSLQDEEGADDGEAGVDRARNMLSGLRGRMQGALRAGGRGDA